MEIPEDLKDIESYDVRHGPVIAAYCDKIGLVSIINKALKANMDIDPQSQTKFQSYRSRKFHSLSQKNITSSSSLPS